MSGLSAAKFPVLKPRGGVLRLQNITYQCLNSQSLIFTI